MKPLPLPPLAARFRGARLQSRLIVSFCALFLAGVALVVGCVLFGVPGTRFEGLIQQEIDGTTADLHRIADARRATLDLWLGEKRKDAWLLTSIGDLREHTEFLAQRVRAAAKAGNAGPAFWAEHRRDPVFREMQEVLTAWRDSDPAFVSIGLVDAQTGLMLVSTRNEALGLDLSANPLFLQTRSPLYPELVSIFTSPIDRLSHLSIWRQVEAAGDAANAAAEPVAVALFLIDTSKSVFPMLNAPDLSFGESGEVVLVDMQQRPLVAPLHALPDGRRLRPLVDRIDAPAARLAAHGSDGELQTVDYRGTPVLTSYRHIRISPDFGWGMVVKKDLAEVMSPVRQAVLNVVLVGVLATLLILPLAYWLTRRLIRPLAGLTEVARRVAGGELSARAQLSGDDEIARLGATFDDMAAQVESAHSLLEAKVVERTQQLRQISVAVLQINRDLALEAVRLAVVRSAVELTGATGGAAGMLEDGCMVFRESLDQGRVIPLNDLFAPGAGVPGRIMQTREPYLSADAANDPQISAERRQRLGLTNLIGVPILSSGGELLGCFELYNKPGGFDDDDTVLLQGLAASAAVALENARLLAAAQRAEQARGLSEKRLSELVNNVKAIIWEVELPSWRFSYVSRQAQTILGYPPAAWSELDFWVSHIHPGDQGWAPKFCMACTERSEDHAFEYRMIAADGRTVWLRDMVALARDEAGKVVGLHGVMVDISDQKEMEERLRLAATVFESTLEGVIVTDAATRIIAVNRAFCEITGYTEEDVRGRTPAVLHSGRQDAAFYAAMWQSLKAAGRWQGELWNRSKNGAVYPEWLAINVVRDSHGEVVNYVGVFTDISEVKRAQQRLDFQAHHDPLTGLPNRLLFDDRVAHAITRAQREGSELAVMFIDLDRFKEINDTLGHPVGDEVLVRVARSFASVLRENDTIARLGGDEFILLIESLDGEAGAALVAEKLTGLFARSLQIREHEFFVTASIGVSLYPRDGDDVAALVKNADTAMYRAKESGRNGYAFYRQELTSHIAERIALENRLRRAVAGGELALHYQPQIDIATGAVIGVEALLRWNSPELGAISPGRFIPVAEQSGLIIPIGAWVIREACRQMRAWQLDGVDVGRVSVNLAGQQIERSDILATVEGALAATGLAPECLEVEVTETFIMSSDKADEVLRRLRAIGVTVAIDDFGTGYSSLSYLTRLPISKLKIDQSFVRVLPHDRSGVAIARAIIELGHAIDLKVIAEGVELDGQLALLRELECDEAQGFLLSRPVPPEQIAGFIASNRQACSPIAPGRVADSPGNRR